ncbi:unnamed protein product, partial [Prorocentrum cordatum]
APPRRCRGERGGRRPLPRWAARWRAARAGRGRRSAATRWSWRAEAWQPCRRRSGRTDAPTRTPRPWLTGNRCAPRRSRLLRNTSRSPTARSSANFGMRGAWGSSSWTPRGGAGAPRRRTRPPRARPSGAPTAAASGGGRSATLCAGWRATVTGGSCTSGSTTWTSTSATSPASALSPWCGCWRWAWAWAARCRCGRTTSDGHICIVLQDRARRIFIHIGSQGDRAYLNELAERLGPLDIVLDDASHHSEHMRNAFEAFYPRMHPHGVYIVEDVSETYREGAQSPFVEYARGLVHKLNAYSTEQFGRDSPDAVTRTTHSIAFYDSMVVFERRPRRRPVSLVRGDRAYSSEEVYRSRVG